MNSAAYRHLLAWWIEELANALLRGIWIRYHAARHSGDKSRGASIYGRFVRLVDRHDWSPCRIEWWESGQLLVTASPRDDYEDFDEEAFA